MKYLITYVYYETENSVFNLNFFIKNGVFENDNVQYNFIINSNSISVNLPNYRNVNLIKSNNKGYDFGAYSESIDSVNTEDFDYFIFLNDTVRGPFVPRYLKRIWYEDFVSLISDNIKLVGSTINRERIADIDKHVQSMAFGTDRVGIDLLIKNNILNKNFVEKVYNDGGKDELIVKFEVNMSGIIIKNGYQISSFMQIENNSIEIPHGDIHYSNLYFGSTINPIECMFIKTNRINNRDIENYTYWNS